MDKSKFIAEEVKFLGFNLTEQVILKIFKALEEEVFIKNITRKVNQNIKTCTICQMVKTNNEKKEGTMIPITSTTKLEKVFLDICGPFPRRGGRHKSVSYTHLDVYKRQLLQRASRYSHNMYTKLIKYLELHFGSCHLCDMYWAQ